MCDPFNHLVNLILYVYTMDTFLPAMVNNASRNKDESKVITLGPIAFILQQILYFAPSKRTDIDTYKFESFVYLYRGASLTNA